MKFKPPGKEELMVGITSGHSIVIAADGSTSVPPRFRKAAIAAGCSPVGLGADDDELTPEQKRSQLIASGINKLLDGDDPKAFNQDGSPNLKKLNETIGFQAAREEVDAEWAKLKPSDDGDDDSIDAADAGDE